MSLASLTIYLRGRSPWCQLTLILLKCRIWRAPDNASKWQMIFNLAFKGLNRRVVGTHIRLEGLKTININPLNTELNPICQ